MDFSFTEEQLAIQRAARDFARQECLPGVIERDEHQKFPHAQIMMLADLGFMGMMVDPKYGGAGMDTVSYVLAMEEISKIDSSVSVAMSVNNSLVCWGLDTFGSHFQKDKYLRPLAAGKKNGELYIGAFLLSEPEAGRDGNPQRPAIVRVSEVQEQVNQREQEQRAAVETGTEANSGIDATIASFPGGYPGPIPGV
jgi:alkylation response protein AidB-like acyl-CoA dehydrogenase